MAASEGVLSIFVYIGNNQKAKSGVLNKSNIFNDRYDNWSRNRYN